jgi:creatinine amidohydrolase/Fe(II)-dependent formamide hydrolase-like protein
MKFHAHALILGLLLLAPPAAAQMPRAGVTLEDFTWTEVRDRISGGATTILVPIGGTEQNGPHMVLGKHNVRVRVLAEKIAGMLGNALVAPVIAYTPESAGHLRFPGTITVSDAAFEAVLESAARSFRRAGFRDIVFIGDHGGYQKDLQVAAARLNGEWKTTNTRAHAIVEYYAVAGTSYVQALKARGYGDDEIGTHAGLADTSLALAADPSLVRSSRLTAGAKLTAVDGVYGDPRRASAELGKIGVDMIVARTVDAIRKAIAQR